MKYGIKAKLNRLEDDMRCAIGCFFIKLGSYIAVNMTDYSFQKGKDEVDWKRRGRKTHRHNFMYFGDQNRRRCTDCNVVEPTDTPPQ